MSTEHQIKDTTHLTEKVEGSDQVKSTLKKRLIWQHLAQKKIRRAIRRDKLKISYKVD